MKASIALALMGLCVTACVSGQPPPLDDSCAQRGGLAAHLQLTTSQDELLD